MCACACVCARVHAHKQGRTSKRSEDRDPDWRRRRRERRDLSENFAGSLFFSLFFPVVLHSLSLQNIFHRLQLAVCVATSLVSDVC